MDYDQNARLAQGDDKTLAISVANPTGADITGMATRYVLLPTPMGPAPPLIEKTGLEVVTVNVPPGFDFILKVRLSNDDTKALAPGWYYHEASVVLASGAVISAMSGQLRVDPSWIGSHL